MEPSDSQRKRPQVIRRFDYYGREVTYTREEWLKVGLMPNIENAWNDADALDGVIMGAMAEGYHEQMVKPAERLYEIGADPERSSAILATVYREVGRDADSEKVLRRFVKKHGEHAVIVSGLAMLAAKRGEADKAFRLLWRALELDPNLAPELGWALRWENERTGGSRERALEKVAAFPGSWRAQCWIARAALQRKDLAEAEAIYDELLTRWGREAPPALLGQISGDLGMTGFPEDAVRIVLPKFDASLHGWIAGNNLINALFELGRLEEAQEVVDRLFAQRVDSWHRDLDRWEHKIAARRTAAEPAFDSRSIQVAAMRFEGPVWMNPSSRAWSLFPGHRPDDPWIGFVGSSVRIPHEEEMVGRPTLTDGAGRLSRSLPLLLAEQVHMTTRARAKALLPLILPSYAHFVSIEAYSEEGACRTAASSGPFSYLVVSHIDVCKEPWTMQLRLVRTSDEQCVAGWECPFDRRSSAEALRTVVKETLSVVCTELELERLSGESAYELPQGQELARYSVELEQLATARAHMPEAAEDSFSGKHGALDWAFGLCTKCPENVPVRLIAAELLRAFAQRTPALRAEYGPKLRCLHAEFPLREPAQGILQEIVDEVTGP